MQKNIIFIFTFILLNNIRLCAQCVDFTDLRSASVICTYGDFYNPYQHIGIIDDGPKAGSSRHTIHTDVSECDPRTGNKLHTIPQGEFASVRLGNWTVGAQAESVTYKYYVDIDENPILVFKYAAVMEDPGHTPEEQPRLTLEILDENNTLVDSYCGAFDFIASQSLGWNISEGGVLWKDWTSVGIDLSAYSGQTIHIRFTTYDCERTGHYGYAYINISCQKKKIKSLMCGINSNSTFSGPDGFEYKWYTLDGSNKRIIDTTQSITVPTDETMYYCDVNQTGKPTCYFSLGVKADPRLPLANFSYQKKGTCVDTLYLTNLSAVSKDGQLPNSPLEDCDEYIWDLGDGRTITSKDINQPIIYENSGTYKISLTAKLTNGNCEDIYEREIFMHGYSDNHTHILYDTICGDELYVFGKQKIDQAGTYTHIVETAYGCDSTTILHLHVNPTYFFEYSEYTCEGKPYFFHGRKLMHSGVYYDSLKTIHGCDSIYKLKLHVYPNSMIETRATICSNETYDFRGRVLSKTGVYYDSLVSSNGCDSIYKLELQVNPTHETLQTIKICQGENYVFKGEQLVESGVYYDTLKTIYGCDSIIKLLLINLPTYLYEQSVTICDNESYIFRGEKLTKTGTYYDFLKTNSGCDSIYKLNLTVNPTYYFETITTICDNHPYLYRDKIYKASGIYYDSLKTNTGCDSIYKLDLTVNKTYHSTEVATICDFEAYHFQGKMLNKTGIYIDTIPTYCGCDSILKLTLRVRPTLRDTLNTSICLGDYYMFGDKMLYNDGTYIDTLYNPESTGCEIHILNLNTVATTLISSAYVHNVCANDTTYQIFYNYVGATPLTYSLHYDNKARMMGFKDVCNAKFTNSIFDKIPQFDNGTYLRPDVYNVRIEFDNGTCLPSTSAYDLSFMVRYPSWVIEQNWNDVVAVLNKEYNGGYSFKQFDWYINNDEYEHNGQSYIYVPQYLHTGDVVYVGLTRNEDDYAICTCPIIISDMSNSFAYDEPVLISVNKIKKELTIFTDKPTSYSIINTSGSVILSGVISDEGTTPLLLETLPAGNMYLIVFTNGQHNTITYKFIL